MIHAISLNSTDPQRCPAKFPGLIKKDGILERPDFSRPGPLWWQVWTWGPLNFSLLTCLSWSLARRWKSIAATLENVYFAFLGDQARILLVNYGGYNIHTYSIKRNMTPVNAVIYSSSTAFTHFWTRMNFSLFLPCFLVLHVYRLLAQCNII